MKKRKNIFKEEKNNRTNSLKYFIIAFSAFIVILACFSAFMFMRSVDFDLGNLVRQTESDTGSDITEPSSANYSAASLTGKSEIAFICTDKVNNLEFAFVVSTDFDKKSMTVKEFEKSEMIPYDGENISCADIYKKHSVDGLKKAFGITSGKYIKCSLSQLKEILNLFEEFSVNVLNKVDYRSADFNLELEAGKQLLSSDLVYKYLTIIEDGKRARVICDIISSMLSPEFTANSEELFSDFVNLCETDISVIDYSQSAEKLIVYSNADDKFLPSAIS